MNNIDSNKDYIYVLKLVDDRYYIGRSQNIVQRIEDHFSGNGSIYTKKYKPLSVVEIVEEKTIDDENIRKLYCLDNKDIIEIGKELDLTPGSIAYRLKKMNIILSKKLANGYHAYITSGSYKEICKDYSIKKSNPKYIKPNVVKEHTNYKEKIKKIIDDNQEIKFDTKNIKDKIRSLLLKSNLV